MHFLVNNVSLDFFLEKYNLTQAQRDEWVKRLRNDFDEKFDNNWVVKLVLNVPQSKLAKVVDTGHVTEFEDLESKTLSEQEKNDLVMRFLLFCSIIETDYVSLVRWEKLKAGEPNILDRFSHCYFTDTHLVIMFEEFEE